MNLRRLLSIGPYEGVDFGHINAVESLHSLLDLVLIGLDTHMSTSELFSIFFMADLCSEGI